MDLSFLSLISCVLHGLIGHIVAIVIRIAGGTTVSCRILGNLIGDWNEYEDYTVWLTARKMLEELLQAKDKKIPQDESEDTSKSRPRTPTVEDAELWEAPPNTEEINSCGPSARGDDGFVLEKLHADILLKRKVYFVHFPSVYCYDENHIICRIGEGPKYHQVTTIVPNPPGPQDRFDIGGITYGFDQHGVLWYAMGEFWLPEVTYPALDLALTALVEYIEKNNLHLAADANYSIPSSDPSHSISNDVEIQDANMGAPEEGLRALSASPDQEEIDSWLDDMKRHRAMQVKDGIRVSPIHCPIPTCGKFQRRPQALRDHLYFHFDLRPHRCDYGCPLSFETEANKNRHLEACPMLAVDNSARSVFDINVNPEDMPLTHAPISPADTPYEASNVNTGTQILGNLTTEQATYDSTRFFSANAAGDMTLVIPCSLKTREATRQFITTSLNSGQLGRGIRRVKCSLCKNQNANKLWDIKPSNLERHILAHLGIKCHRCHYCAIEFTTKDQMKRHIEKKHDFIRSANSSPLE